MEQARGHDLGPSPSAATHLPNAPPLLHRQYNLRSRSSKVSLLELDRHAIGLVDAELPGRHPLDQALPNVKPLHAEAALAAIFFDIRPRNLHRADPLLTCCVCSHEPRLQSKGLLAASIASICLPQKADRQQNSTDADPNAEIVAAADTRLEGQGGGGRGFVTLSAETSEPSSLFLMTSAKFGIGFCAALPWPCLPLEALVDESRRDVNKRQTNTPNGTEPLFGRERGPT